MKLKNILSQLDYVKFIGCENTEICEIVKLDDNNFKSTSLVWISESNRDKIEEVEQGTIICHESSLEFKLKKSCNYIFTKEPRKLFQMALDIIYPEEEDYYISNSAIVKSELLYADKVRIGENVVIEENVKIGQNVEIGSNTVIMKNTVIHDNVKIGSNCSIGGCGFGYEVNEDGHQVRIKHIGGVEIFQNVEIGSNTCIDRATLGNTILREGVKVDNLVHIAHGVDIGAHSVIIANSMIAGSVSIGERSWISPSSSIIDRIKIGSESIVGLGAIVLKEVASKDVVVGNPARSLKK